jgi:ribose transport system substrate-binding protein
MVKQAVAAKIEVALATDLACNHTIPPGVISFSGVQSPETYEKWWDYILTQNKPQPFAAIVGPSTLDITKYTESTLKTAMKDHPGFTLAANVQTDYSTAQAYKATQDLLRAHPEVKLIASNYAGMTQGVARALQAAHRTDVKVFDLMGDHIVADLIQKGTVTATLPGLPRDETAIAVQNLVAGWTGKKVERDINPVDLLKIPGGPWVTKENVADFEPQY